MLLLVLTIILGLGLGCRVPSLLRGVLLVVPPPRSTPWWSSCLVTSLSSGALFLQPPLFEHAHQPQRQDLFRGPLLQGRTHVDITRWRTGILVGPPDYVAGARSLAVALIAPAHGLASPPFGDRWAGRRTAAASGRCRLPRWILHGAAGGDRPRALAWPGLGRDRLLVSRRRCRGVVEVGAAWAGVEW